MRAQERLPRRWSFRHGRKAVRLQDPGNRRSADAVSEVLQRPLNPRIAPRRIPRRHAHDQLADLRERASTARRWVRVRPLPRNELPVPAQQRIGGDDRSDLAQPPTAQPVRPNSEPPPVVIGQAQVPPPTAAAGGGSRRSDRPAPPVPGDRASRSRPLVTSGRPRGRSRAGGYITAGAAAFTNRSADLWDRTARHCERLWCAPSNTRPSRGRPACGKSALVTRVAPLSIGPRSRLGGRSVAGGPRRCPSPLLRRRPRGRARRSSRCRRPSVPPPSAVPVR
jgi:hypothetical protein